MKIAKKCRKCGDFFPSKSLSLNFYCQKEECQKAQTRRVNYIKQTRSISLDHFDIYDLDSPIYYEDKIIDYERVCRICGAPLRKRDGSYSHHMKYCHQTKYCSSEYLFDLVSWPYVSKNYAYHIRQKHITQIKTFVENNILSKEITLPLLADSKDAVRRSLEVARTQIYHRFIICEECKKICFIDMVRNFFITTKTKGTYSLENLFSSLKDLDTIQIHHITPVHTLTITNLHLIWDRRNLIALCPNCHNHQNHYLTQRSKEGTIINYMNITDFF